MRWPNGDTYCGQFANNKRHGLGLLCEAGGARYQGEWKDDKRHGLGETTKPNGERANGTWENGSLTI